MLAGVAVVLMEDRPTIILKMANGEKYWLRPLFFAYQDRTQMASLFVETRLPFIVQKSNLQVLSQAEKDVSQQEALEGIKLFKNFSSIVKQLF